MMKILMPLLFVLISCSHLDHSKLRVPNSTDFECHFSEKIAGKNTKFNFIPEKLILEVVSDKGERESISLEENDFLSGGFSYRTSKADRNQKWNIIIDFISDKNAPLVRLHVRNPEKLDIEKSCQKL